MVWGRLLDVLTVRWSSDQDLVPSCRQVKEQQALRLLGS